jgi:hypothetical protein
MIYIIIIIVLINIFGLIAMNQAIVLFAKKPVAKPSKPSTKPVAKPSKPSTKPVAKPGKSSTKPVAKPSKSSTKPVAKPSKSSAKPVAKPGKSSTKPVAKPHTPAKAQIGRRDKTPTASGKTPANLKSACTTVGGQWINNKCQQFLTQQNCAKNGGKWDGKSCILSNTALTTLYLSQQNVTKDMCSRIPNTRWNGSQCVGTIPNLLNLIPTIYSSPGRPNTEKPVVTTPTLSRPDAAMLTRINKSLKNITTPLDPVSAAVALSRYVPGQPLPNFCNSVKHCEVLKANLMEIPSIHIVNNKLVGATNPTQQLILDAVNGSSSMAPVKSGADVLKLLSYNPAGPLPSYCQASGREGCMRIANRLQELYQTGSITYWNGQLYKVDSLSTYPKSDIRRGELTTANGTKVYGTVDANSGIFVHRLNYPPFY